MEKIFIDGFDSFACVDDSIAARHEGFLITAHIEADDDAQAPWNHEDGHGPVSDWTMRPMKSGEMILHQIGPTCRYYDYAEACKIAKRDGWSFAPNHIEIESGANGLHRAKALYTDELNESVTMVSNWYMDVQRGFNQIYEEYKASMSAERYAEKAAKQDYKALESWCRNDWFYGGIVVTVKKNGITLCDKYKAALWGIEINYPRSDNNRLLETANELANEALAIAKETLAKLCDC